MPRISRICCPRCCATWRRGADPSPVSAGRSGSLRQDIPPGSTAGLPPPGSHGAPARGLRYGHPRRRYLGDRRKRRNRRVRIDLPASRIRPSPLCRSLSPSPGDRPGAAGSSTAPMRRPRRPQMQRGQPRCPGFLPRCRLPPGGMGLGRQRPLDSLPVLRGASGQARGVFPLYRGGACYTSPAAPGLVPWAASRWAAFRTGGRGGTGRRARFRFW